MLKGLRDVFIRFKEIPLIVYDISCKFICASPLCLETRLFLVSLSNFRKLNRLGTVDGSPGIIGEGRSVCDNIGSCCSKSRGPVCAGRFVCH